MAHKVRCGMCKKWFGEHEQRVAIAHNGGTCNSCTIELLRKRIKGQEKIIADIERKLSQISEIIKSEE